MTIPVQFAFTVLGAVFAASVVYATMRADIRNDREAQQRENAQLRKDLNGIGAKIRQDEGRAERRWKHMIATQIETSSTTAAARKYGALLREDAWRD